MITDFYITKNAMYHLAILCYYMIQVILKNCKFDFLSLHAIMQGKCFFKYNIVLQNMRAHQTSSRKHI